MLEYKLDIEKRSVWVTPTDVKVSQEMPLFLTEIGKFYAGKDYYTRRSDKAGYFLVFTHSGSGIMQIDGKSYDLRPNYAMLIDCNEPHLYKTGPDGKWITSWMHVDGVDFKVYGAFLKNTPVQLDKSTAFSVCFKKIINRSKNNDVVSAAQISLDISFMLTEMLIALNQSNESVSPNSFDSVAAAVAFIEKEYQKPINIDDIAAAVNISKYYFVRLFKKHMGVTPYNYLIRYRIDQAKALLRTTDLSVHQIALQVGYASESNFIRQFYRLAEETPAQYRKHNCLEVGKAAGQ